MAGALLLPGSVPSLRPTRYLRRCWMPGGRSRLVRERKSLVCLFLRVSRCSSPIYGYSGPDAVPSRGLELEARRDPNRN